MYSIDWAVWRATWSRKCPKFPGPITVQRNGNQSNPILLSALCSHDMHHNKGHYNQGVKLNYINKPETSNHVTTYLLTDNFSKREHQNVTRIFHLTERRVLFLKRAILFFQDTCPDIITTKLQNLLISVKYCCTPILITPYFADLSYLFKHTEDSITLWKVPAVDKSYQFSTCLC